MIIVDPVTLGDAACTRPSPKWVYDRTGTLVEVPANTLGVTYDPSALSKAPYALVEPEATNSIRNNTMQGAVVGAFGSGGAVPTNWSVDKSAGQNLEVVAVGQEGGTNYIDVRFWTLSNDRGYFGLYPERSDGLNVPAGPEQLWAYSQFVKIVAGAAGAVRVTACVRALTSAGAQINTTVTDLPLGEVLSRFTAYHPNTPDGTARLTAFVLLEAPIGAAFDFTVRIGLPQLQRDRVDSPIKTSGTAVTRAADVIGPGAGLIYSNVPMIEPPYDAAATYAKDALVRDPVTHEVYKSLMDANKGKPLTDEASWNSRGKTNRWAMFDDYNNTQTTSPEEIVVVLSPQSICEGLYLGNVDADEIELVVVDQSEGVVFSEVISLVTAGGSSSYYDWCFRPADRADYYFTVAMPPYASALVTVVLRKPGGVAKCGMAAIGLVDDFGPSLYGLTASGKDFSSTTFNFDGTSKTQYRDYAKKMDVDVQVNNGEIDYIQRKLFQLRQRPIVWVGGPYGATAVFGRYVSFDIVIPGLLKSDMSLQIEGSV